MEFCDYQLMTHVKLSSCSFEKFNWFSSFLLVLSIHHDEMNSIIINNCQWSQTSMENEKLLPK
jgi:hypothetical protein